MFYFIDQYVLSQAEKFYQFLQRKFGIKRRTIIDLGAGFASVTILSALHTSDNLPLAFTGIGLIFVLSLAFYVLRVSRIDQELAELRAENGIMAPEKIARQFIAVRTVLNLIIVAFTASFFLDVITPMLVNLFSTLVSLWVFLYFMAVDVLPPSKEKSKDRPKGMFNQDSHQT